MTLIVGGLAAAGEPPKPGVESPIPPAAMEAMTRAAAAENQAHRLASERGGTPRDDELDLLLDAIDESNAVIRLTGTGDAFTASWFRIARSEFRCGRFWEAYLALERSFPEAAQGEVPDPRRITPRITLEKRIADALFAYGLRPVPDATVDGKPANGYEAARKVYRAIVYNDRRHPDAPQAYLRYGECSARTGDVKAAEATYRSIIYIDYPEDPVAQEARLALARILMDRYRGKDADMPEPVRLELSDLLRQSGVAAETLQAGSARRPAKYGPRPLRPETAPPSSSEDLMTWPRPGMPKASEAVGLLEDERDEAAAGELLRQAQAFLNNVRTDKARAAGLSMLKQVTERYPRTKSAEVAESLLNRYQQ